MELAFLVYAISLLHGISGLFVAGIFAGLALIGFFGIWRLSECDRKSYYNERENDERVANGVMCVRWIKRGLALSIISATVLVFVPTEKTAYTMVGAYAAQKVAENDKVQAMSGKVLTIIEQKLDGYIQDGITEAEKRAEDLVKKEKKK